MVEVHDGSVSEYDLCADEAIAGQAVLATEQVDPAAKGGAGDADGETAPGGQRRAAGMQRCVYVSWAGTGADVHCKGRHESEAMRGVTTSLERRQKRIGQRLRIRNNT
ncbi:hypothetical protein [Micromonospora sp. WMMD812]|uniref:hypothetical protein n=1 Tax=Micromonospora sp. WMMD812 TaxID=3015152 RepID=UPI00248B2661|nr:hypothetical protein [Micromonospora sp. WMMD812]WBB69335.1 hypothetical protein O7603_08295 [Micromonospora sp. WMMD812]